MSVHTSLLYLLGDPQDPGVVWEKIADQFQKKTWANKLALRRKLYGLKLKESGSVQQHIKSLMEIFEELSIIGDAIEEEDRVVHVLASLPESYDMLVTALEANSEVPKLETVTERLLNEERKLNEKSGTDGGNVRDPKALAVMRRSQDHQRRSEKMRGPTCYYCGKSGHIKRNCEKLKDDDSNRDNRDSNRGRRNDRGNRSHREHGNTARLRRKEDQECDSSESESGFITVVDHALSSAGPIDKSAWIVDWCASSHMNNDEEQFVEMKELDENDAKKVMVGDGYSVDVKGKGTVEMDVEVSKGVTKRLKLFNVLFVPDLSFNLLRLQARK